MNPVRNLVDYNKLPKIRELLSNQWLLIIKFLTG
jgi:hypothetical protein